MVVATEILGAQLPSTVAGWILLLIGILTALLTTVLAIEKFVELFGGDTGNLRRYGGGLALPAAWGCWSVFLLVADRSPAAVLSVLLGTLIITSAGQMLVRKCRA